MQQAPSRRFIALAAVLAVVAAVLSPLILSSPAVASACSDTGSVSGDSWVDSTLDPMTTGVAYSSTLTLPSSNGPWGGVTANNLPAGLSMSVSGDTVTISGTPTGSGAVDPFSFTADGGDGAHTELTFSSLCIDPGLPSTSTALVSSVQASPYTGLSLTATVTGSSPTGTVTFSVYGTTIGTETLSGGVATFTGAISSSYIGLYANIVATYEGDENNAASTSTAVNVFIFRTSTVSGTVSQNGSPLVTTVELQHWVTLSVVDSTTSTGGNYSFTVPGVDTVAEAQTEYYIRAQVGSGYVYYSSDGGPGQPNQVLTDADRAGPVTWGTGYHLYSNVAPVWSDTTLATPAEGSAYSDYVAATGTAVLHYTVTEGSLPDGLTLDELTGEIHGTPTSQDSETFTITASNDYGSVEHEFTLEPGPPGVAPTWSETEIDDLVVGETVADSVTAVGDPTIVYSVSSGTLPPGLVLDTATGAITGTPTAEGEFEFTLTATNAYGHVDEGYCVTVAPAPELELELKFAPGTSIDDAETEISASGLEVGSEYTLDMHSDPIRLYTGIVDSSGGFTWIVDLPADTPPGAHELILTGVAPGGAVLTARAWFTLYPNGTIGAISYSGPLFMALAFTGTEPLLPLGIASLLVLGGYLAMRRPRAVPVPLP